MTTKQPKYSMIFAGHDNAGEMAQYAQVAWVEALADLEAQGQVTKPRLNILDRYVRARTEYEFMYSVAMCEGATITADSGGQYANMKYAAVGKLSDQLMKFEEALLFSPKAVGDKLRAKPSGAGATPSDEFLQPVARVM